MLSDRRRWNRCIEKTRVSDDLGAALQREWDYRDLFDANKSDYVAVCGRSAVKICTRIICAHHMQELQPK
jgi:hypothetical protein